MQVYRLMNAQHIVFFATRQQAEAFRRSAQAFKRRQIKAVLQLQPWLIQLGQVYRRG